MIICSIGSLMGWREDNQPHRGSAGHCFMGLFLLYTPINLFLLLRYSASVKTRTPVQTVCVRQNEDRATHMHISPVVASHLPRLSTFFVRPGHLSHGALICRSADELIRRQTKAQTCCYKKITLL